MDMEKQKSEAVGRKVSGTIISRGMGEAKDAEWNLDMESKSQEQQRNAETGAVNDSLKIGVRPARSERATQALSFSASEA
ncbi:hypothetical protein FOIG_00391 [Fusarium odoratissimum NRRL 54006]|uniref:Uncharacterized protein n=1 Tax=Fusarium odoratissimum (strain NRRL 54006) TaxID=1089451 RepID=X0KNC9_FUSO5|nr:uncharacterized protein FOIG_00391 [Fusarium odoratissimum NRRL 54006]EXM10186.1 hypothetical protein FOIG_00391 [Fusarium odoratissimum NRRL 54006]